MRPRVFARIMTALTLSHLTVNIVRRFAYPFLPAISRILGVPLIEVQNVVAVQAGVGVLSPMLGGWLEPYSRKYVLIGTLLAMASVSALGVFLQGFVVFAVLMILLGIGKIVFQPTLIAYLGEKIAFSQRGRAVGISELSWSGSMLVAAPVAGFLLAGANGLQWVFGLLALSFLLGALLLWFWLPHDKPIHADNMDRGALAIIPVLKRNPRALGALFYSFFLVIAIEMFFINYGAFMEISFGLMLTALGAVSVVIALAEMSGGLGVIGIADRLGKKRFTLFGAFGVMVMLAALPLIATNLWLALLGLFILFFFTETAIVASLALYTEVVPEARNVFMSANVGVHSVGRLTGAMLGAWLYPLLGDFVLLGLASAGVGALSVLCLWFFVTVEG